MSPGAGEGDEDQCRQNHKNRNGMKENNEMSEA